jgi:hypothetical protein
LALAAEVSERFYLEPQPCPPDDGLPSKSLQGFGVPTESYGFANTRLAWETIAPLLDRASPLRTFDASRRSSHFG